MNRKYRHTKQFLLPVRKPDPPGSYDIYPAFHLPEGRIFEGLESLIQSISGFPAIMIDGYVGVFFDLISEVVTNEFDKLEKRVHWVLMEEMLREEEEIDRMIAPFLGGGDPVFGKRTTLDLDAFFDPQKLAEISPDPEADITIVIGPGAALGGLSAPLIYVDLPKNELQFRARAGAVRNLGARQADHPKAMYKRFYFVDWVVLNKHKKQLLPRIHAFVDGQRPGAYTWMRGEDFREALHGMARQAFRPRPWFEPGAWGGQWIRKHIRGLSPDVPNYAWSFELITPENGLVFESGNILLEASFDFLMYQEQEAVLGRHADVFGDQFPIRFDFLDTFDGGNLSIQCHPRPEYIQEHFGEDITQEETYYILDADKDAICYLGFQEDIDPAVFQAVLEESALSGTEVDIREYVMVHPSRKHDLFLIPPGTIHSSGKGNLVLEISATPYIFTFKMYDWLRLDLDGNPRPLNIRRGMENLYFERCGEHVRHKLISKPVLEKKGDDWKVERLPTHEQHSYAIRRYTFKSRIRVETGNHCHVMSLVEGTRIRLEAGSGRAAHFHYAETFVVPAAAEAYWLINESASAAVVVQAYMKPVDHLKKTLPPHAP